MTRAEKSQVLIDDCVSKMNDGLLFFKLKRHSINNVFRHACTGKAKKTQPPHNVSCLFPRRNLE